MKADRKKKMHVNVGEEKEREKKKDKQERREERVFRSWVLDKATPPVPQQR